MVQNVGCLKENTYLCNRKSEMNALLAQLVEQLTLNQWAGVPTVRKFDRAVLEQPAFVATDGDFGVYATASFTASRALSSPRPAPIPI